MSNDKQGQKVLVEPSENTTLAQLRAEAHALDAAQPSGQEPNRTELWEKSQRAGVAGVFADVMSADVQPVQAFFVAWLGLYQRPGGAELLKEVGLPTTKTEAAAYLGRSRQTLARWEAADWFKRLGVNAWLHHHLTGMIPKALHRLEENITTGSGPVSNGAIRILQDWHSNARGGLAATPALQVNVAQQQINQRANDHNRVVNFDEHLTQLIETKADDK